MKSLTLDIYNKLYDDILAFKYKPGQRLHIANLCREYNVSLSAVREALSQLTATNFVFTIPQKGFRVAYMSVEDMLDLYTTRSHIEEMALRLAITNGTDEWKTDCLTAYQSMEDYEQSHSLRTLQEYEAWEERNRAYNFALLRACNLQHLLQLQAHLYRQSERYRRLLVVEVLKNNETLPFAGYQKKILDACMQKDAEKAINLLRMHFSMAKEALSQVMLTSSMSSAEEIQQAV